MSSDCILYQRECIHCGECDICDLDPHKSCNNCCKCIDTNADYKSIGIDEIIEDPDVEKAEEKRDDS